MTDTCLNCGAQIHTEGTTWVDNSGGDVCGVDGTNGPHVPDLDAALDAATTNSINAEETEVKIAVKLMCLRARIVFGEDARYIVLDDSDQGTWAVVDDVTDGGRNSLLGDGDDDYWEDGQDYAAHLYDNRVDVWKLYLVEGTWGGRRNPGVGILDIEKVFEAMDRGEL